MFHLIPAVTAAVTPVVHNLAAFAAPTLHTAITAVVDIKSPFTSEVLQPVADFAPAGVVLGSFMFLVKKIHEHRGEGVGMVVMEAAALAASGIGGIEILKHLGGIA